MILASTGNSFHYLVSFNDFAFADKQNGLGVSFDDNGAPLEVETHDGGKTWADKNFTGYPMGLFITVIPFTHTFLSTIPHFVPVAGSSYSNDYGATWELIDTSSDFNPFAVAFLNPLIGWSGRADSPDPNGGIYKWKSRFSLDGNSITSNNNDENISYSSITKIDAANLKTLRLNPNPAKNGLKVEGLNASIKTTLSIFNASGKMVQQSIATGETYTFNLQKLAAGNYYIRIESDKKVTTLKFVKE